MKALFTVTEAGDFLPVGAVVEFAGVFSENRLEWNPAAWNGGKMEPREYQWGQNLGVLVLDEGALRRRPGRGCLDPARKLYRLSIARSSLRPANALAQAVIDDWEDRYEKWMSTRIDRRCDRCGELLNQLAECDDPACLAKPV